MSDFLAPPKRNRLKDFDEQAALFLRKAHHLISNCPEYLGGWTANGETFVIKDAKVFSEKVIPTVYKHNNFSSFVRQLNFYGFKKIKTELSSIENPLWEFRHPSFLKGSPELLSEIKRAVYPVVKTETAASKETDDLKLTIIELRERLVLVDRSISSLTHLVSDFMKDSCDNPRSSMSTASLLYDGDPLAVGCNRCGQHDHMHIKIESPDSAASIVAKSIIQEPFAASPSKGVQGEDCDDDSDDDSLDELLTLCKGGHPGEHIPDSEDVYDNVDFEDFLSFASNLPEVLEDDTDVRNRSISLITDVGGYMDTESATVSIDCVEPPRTRSRTLSAIAQPVSVQDIPFIIAQLPSGMQERFLDKFADAAGVNYNYMLNVSRKRALSNEKLTLEENSRQRTLSQQQDMYERIDDLAERRLSRRPSLTG